MQDLAVVWVVVDCLRKSRGVSVGLNRRGRRDKTLKSPYESREMMARHRHRLQRDLKGVIANDKREQVEVRIVLLQNDCHDDERGRCFIAAPYAGSKARP